MKVTANPFILAKNILPLVRDSSSWHWCPQVSQDSFSPSRRARLKPVLGTVVVRARGNWNARLALVAVILETKT